MKFIPLIASLFVFFTSFSQSSFPKDWIGNWKGELLWYKGHSPEPQAVKMELRIQPTDSAHKFTWHMVYGSPSQDSRPYILMAKDTTKGHWVIDENNGIVLDQFFLANKFCGAFTVQSSTIINNYWIAGGKLHIEFYNILAKPIATTGKGTDDSPSVNSYQVRSYQYAVLDKN